MICISAAHGQIRWKFLDCLYRLRLRPWRASAACYTLIFALTVNAIVPNRGCIRGQATA